MEPIQYIRALRRRWIVILVAIVVGCGVAWSTMKVIPVTEGPKTATATVLVTGTRSSSSSGATSEITDPNTIAALATIGEVPQLVAKDIGYEGDPLRLAAKVTVNADVKSGLLNITTTDANPERGKQLADSFANNLIKFLGDRQRKANDVEAAALKPQIQELQKEIAKLQKKADKAAPSGSSTPGQAGGGSSGLTSQINSKQQELDQLNQQYNDLVHAVIDPGVEVVQQAAITGGGKLGTVKGPRTRLARLLAGFLVGLIGGVALALVLERFDTRIKSKEAAEKSFGLPVLAEIPFIRRSKRGPGKIAAAPNSRSAPADAFRILRTGVSGGSLNGAVVSPQPDGNSKAEKRKAPRTVLITSSGPGEGKTTLAANLAGSFAELGKRVIVISCDFRNPAIHRVFGIPNEMGLSDALQSANGGPILDSCIRETRWEAIRLVPSGSTPASPGELMNSVSMDRALSEAVGDADVVLLDSVAVLAGTEAVQLLSKVDAVVVVARSGRTPRPLAERTSELLKRADAPVVGVALNASREAVAPGGSHAGWRRLTDVLMRRK